MAVRFPCQNCHQPIETDSEWAGRKVRCPYCLQVVDAPFSSTLEVERGAGSPTPGSPPPSSASRVPFDRTASGPAATPPVPRISNPAATTAAVFAGMLLGLSIALFVFHWRNREPLRQYNAQVMRLVETEGLGLMEAHEQAWLRMEKQGRIAPLLLPAMSLLQLASMATWLATIIAAAIGLRRRAGRRWAVGALVVAIASPVLCCTGVLVTFPSQV